MRKITLLAAKLWKNIKPSLKDGAVVLALEGPLGSGKTTLVKALALEMEIKDEILSPTFILNTQYSVLNTQLDHIDAWRVEDFEEIERLGLAEMIKNKHLIIIEWADKFRNQILALSTQCSVIWIKIEYGKGKNERIIIYENIGN